MNIDSNPDAERELADARERIRRAVSHIARSAYLPAFLRAQLLEMLVDAPEPLHDTVPCPPPAGANQWVKDPASNRVFCHPAQHMAVNAFRQELRSGGVRLVTSELMPNDQRAVLVYNTVEHENCPGPVDIDFAGKRHCMCGFML